MKQTLYIYLLAAFTLLSAACSDDNPGSSTEGTEGALSFTVTGAFPAFEQTPETRSGGIGIYDQGKMEWETGDEILVRVSYADDSQRGIILTCMEDGTWQSDNVASNRNVSGILAVYAPSRTITALGEFDSKDGQNAWDGEYLEASCDEAAGSEVAIDFSSATRTYSRLRIASEVGKTASISLANFTCPGGEAGDKTELTTDVTADDRGNAYIYGSWDAGSTLSVLIGDETKEFTLPESEVEKSYVVDCRQSIDLATQTRIDINESGDYHFRGTGNTVITIMGVSPNIYLYNVTINESRGYCINAINGGEPTIHVVGENEINEAIFLENGSLTIKGSSPDDVLSVTSDNIGIGGTDGDIVISNVTVRAIGGRGYPGIGFYAPVGTIRIEDATVYAYGAADEGQYRRHSPAIGAAYGNNSPEITIRNSEIHAYRGGYNDTSLADWIGLGYDSGLDNSPTQSIQGTITGTTVHKYMRDCATDEYIDEGSVYYDDGGNVTEQ